MSYYYTSELQKILLSIDDEKEDKIKLLKTCPVVSNYYHYKDSKGSLKLESTCSIFRQNSNTLEFHLDIMNLNRNCIIFLSSAQERLLKKLVDRKTILIAKHPMKDTTCIIL